MPETEVQLQTIKAEIKKGLLECVQRFNILDIVKQSATKGMYLAYLERLTNIYALLEGTVNGPIPKS